MNCFAELTKQVHIINDLILSDMMYENDNTLAEVNLTFSRHLLSTKTWFASMSWANKKRYLLTLLGDIRSAWALSLLLKSIWNCQPKDAVLSANDFNVWSSYDVAPIDHNRTAQPIPTLAQVMKNDRLWFISLEPETQAIVLAELLMIAGGPILCKVLKRAMIIFEKYRADQLRNLEECCVVNDPPAEKTQLSPVASKKNDTPLRKKSSAILTDKKPEPGQAQKDAFASASPTTLKSTTPLAWNLEANLAAWNATIKALKDSVKLEELEMTFKDGTKRKIWKINRIRPEAIETVDFVQLLPAAVGKQILSYLPRAQLGDYAKVNRYWAYLVEDYRAELAARAKIETDLEKLQELMLRNDTSLDVLAQIDFNLATSSLGGVSLGPANRPRQYQTSVRVSERSAGAMSFRHMLSDKTPKHIAARKPFRNLNELKQTLERRGAADENLWMWCENVIKQTKSVKALEKYPKRETEGVLQLGNLHFPCPLMKSRLQTPLPVPLRKDPTAVKTKKPKRNISNATMLSMPRQQGVNKRYSLWTKDFSKLYPVFKIPSHHFTA